MDPEAALRAANAKFTRRFQPIEDWLAEEGAARFNSDLAEMDALWKRAKAEEKASTAVAANLPHVLAPERPEHTSDIRDVVLENSASAP